MPGHLALRLERSSPSGKTHVFRIESTHSQETLGTISWYGPWRRYVFYPAAGTLWDASCILELHGLLSGLAKIQPKQPPEPQFAYPRIDQGEQPDEILAAIAESESAEQDRSRWDASLDRWPR